MKSKLLLITFLCIYFNLSAQIEFQDYIITPNGSNTSNYPTSVFPVDIDGDNDIDVLAASRDDHKIIWYENINFLGDFTTAHIVSEGLYSPNSLYASDVDNDGDMDVIASYSGGGPRVVWYENTNGNGDFGPEQIISTAVNYPLYVASADIDGDGNLDVISTSYYDQKVAWYKNLDGNGTFGSQQIVTLNSNVDHSIFLNDIDGDDDIDMVVGSFAAGQIRWFENDGEGNFTEQVITTNAEAVRTVYVTDIDGDGDSDLIAVLDGPNTIVWYENLNGLGNFSSQQLIKYSSSIGTNVVFSTDIDGDNDNDVISYFTGTGGNVVWYENLDGLGTFDAQQKVISTGKVGITSLNSADINNDGRMDLLSTSQFYDLIVWHENFDPLSTNEFTTNTFEISPNPTSNIVYIKSKNNILKIEIYNSIGQIVLSNSNEKEIDLSGLSQNIYFCKITDENNHSEFMKIIKE